MGNKAEATSERINEMADVMYKLNKQKSEIEQITNKFDELDNKLIKTNEDLKEMSSLLGQAGEKLMDEEVGKKENIGFGEGVSAKAYYEKATTDRGRREALDYINKVSEVRNKRTQNNIISEFRKMDSKEQAKVLNSKDNAKFLETQDTIYSINNSSLYEYMDELKESGSITDEVAASVEKFTQNILDNISAAEA